MACSCLEWQSYSTIAGSYSKQKPCRRKVTSHFRVTYSEALPDFIGHRPKEDVFGLCAKHAKEFLQAGLERWQLQPRPENAEPWIRIAPVVQDQRGIIDSAVQCLPSRGDRKPRVRDHFRCSLKLLLNQEGASILDSDDWREIFDDALNEHVVRKVMSS